MDWFGHEWVCIFRVVLRSRLLLIWCAFSPFGHVSYVAAAADYDVAFITLNKKIGTNAWLSNEAHKFPSGTPLVMAGYPSNLGGGTTMYTSTCTTTSALDLPVTSFKLSCDSSIGQGGSPVIHMSSNTLVGVWGYDPGTTSPPSPNPVFHLLSTKFYPLSYFASSPFAKCAGCNKNAICTSNLPSDGNAVCTCKNGFYGDGKTICTPKPCDYLYGGCLPRSLFGNCTNGADSAICDCQKGYKGDGRTSCKEIDPCQESPNGGCDQNSICKKTGPGKMECVCNKGWIPSGSKTCKWQNPCDLDKGGCIWPATCRNSGANERKCDCPAKWIPDGPTQCKWKDPCAVKNGGCDRNGTCTNTGPDEKQCSCKEGWKGPDAMGKCSWKNPCLDGNKGGCDNTAICSNTGPNQRNCDCPPGWAPLGDGLSCFRDNLCNDGYNGGCVGLATCVRTGAGVRRCDCPDGFLPDGTGNGCKSKTPTTSKTRTTSTVTSTAQPLLTKTSTTFLSATWPTLTQTRSTTNVVGFACPKYLLVEPMYYGRLECAFPLVSVGAPSDGKGETCALLCCQQANSEAPFFFEFDTINVQCYCGTRFGTCPYNYGPGFVVYFVPTTSTTVSATSTTAVPTTSKALTLTTSTATVPRVTTTTGACSINNGGCSVNATCVATSAWTRNCTCKAGFVGNGTWCDTVAFIGAGWDFGVALTTGGVLNMWGNPTRAVGMPQGLMTGVKDLLVTSFHTVLLLENGTVRVWGTYKVTPCCQADGKTGVKAVGVGDDHTALVFQNGTAVVYGNVYAPQYLGYNISVLNGLDVAQIGGSECAGHALTANGSYVYYGYKDGGTFRNVPSNMTGVAKLFNVAGGCHLIAQMSDGTLKAWGGDWNGQATVPANLGSVKSVSSARTTTLALLSNGTISAWGSNPYNLTTVPTTLGKFTKVALGVTFAAGLLENGRITAWGSNSSQQLNVPADFAN